MRGAHSPMRAKGWCFLVETLPGRGRRGEWWMGLRGGMSGVRVKPVQVLLLQIDRRYWNEPGRMERRWMELVLRVDFSFMDS